MSSFNVNIDLIVANWDFREWNVETLTGGGGWIIDGGSGALDFLTISRGKRKSTSTGFFKKLINSDTNS